MNAELLTSTSTDWLAVSHKVTDKLGCWYSAGYCSEIARGRRKSTRVEAALRELGVMFINPPDRNCTSAAAPIAEKETAQGTSSTDALIASNLFALQPCWTPAAHIVSSELGNTYAASYVPQISAGTRTNAAVSRILRRLGMMSDQIKEASSASPLRNNSRLLRQRRTLANNQLSLLRTNRSLCSILAATQDRLAATSTKLGEALNDKLALEARLQIERETSARLDSVVRRLAARPRIKRTTTHVEIAGLTFRNRTTKAVTP